MKKICFIITHLGKGGAQEYVLHILEYLSSQTDYQLYLIFGKRNDYSERLKKLKVTLFQIEELQREISLLKDIKVLSKLVVFLKKEKIDLIHSNSSKAGIFARLVKLFLPALRVVHTVHGFPFDARVSVWRRYFYFLIEKFVSPLTDRLILVSRYNRLETLHFHLLPWKKLRMIHNGFDLKKIDFLKEEKLPLKVEKFCCKFDYIIGTVWRIDEQKGYKVMADAISLLVKKMKKVGFLLVGDGPKREELEKLLKEKGVFDFVYITGFVDNPYPYYLKMDLFWTTSFWEAQPRTICEALYLKIPVVASLVGGTGEVVLDGLTGYTYPIKAYNPLLLEETEFLLRNEGLRKQMGEYGFNLIKNDYSIAKIVKELDTLYQELLI